MELEKAFFYFKRTVDGLWYSNLYFVEMYHNGKGVAVKMKNAIRHFEVLAEYRRMLRTGISPVYIKVKKGTWTRIVQRTAPVSLPTWGMKKREKL